MNKKKTKTKETKTFNGMRMEEAGEEILYMLSLAFGSKVRVGTKILKEQNPSDKLVFSGPFCQKLQIQKKKGQY